MRLVNVRIRGFQSYTSEQTVRLLPDLTVLAGQNNVGKTALLRSVRQVVDPKPGAAANFMVEYEWETSANAIRAAFTHEGQQLLTDHLPHVDSRIRARFETQLPALEPIDVDSGVDPRINGHALTAAEIVGTDLVARPGSHPQGIRQWWTGPGFGNEHGPVYGIRYFWQFIQRLFASSIYIQPRRTGAEPSSSL